MRQLHLRFTPVSGVQPLFADEWRKVVSQRINFAGRNADDTAFKLFHHWKDVAPDDKGGRDKAGVCFLSSSRWVGVLATGPENIDAVRAHMMEFVLAAGDALGPCAVDHHDRTLACTPTSRVYDYVMPQHVSKDDNGKPHTAAFLHGRIVRGLNDWAEQFELEPAFTASDVLLTQFDRLSPAMSKSRSETVWARHRTRVLFSMPYKLDGYWSAGGMSSKGFSFVQYARAEPEGAVE